MHVGTAVGDNLGVVQIMVVDGQQETESVIRLVHKGLTAIADPAYTQQHTLRQITHLRRQQEER